LVVAGQDQRVQLVKPPTEHPLCFLLLAPLEGVAAVPIIPVLHTQQGEVVVLVEARLLNRKLVAQGHLVKVMLAHL
jgi:hypothetical protein